jgi:hypothetical protein
MAGDDANARRARAARLREQIERLKKGSGSAPSRAPADKAEPDGAPLSPRDFVHKKMAELARKNRK